MSTDVRDALYRLLESVEPSAEFKEGMKRLEKELDTITKNIHKVTEYLEIAKKTKDEWKLEREGMTLVVDLIAEKYDGFNEDDLDDLETEDAEVLRHIFGIDVKKRNRDLDIKVQMWGMLLKEYQKKEVSAISEVEEFKRSLEGEIAKSFMTKWKEFSKTRASLSTGSYDLS
jgi:hypothetical protein